jgi:hypothetical protein
MSSAAKLAGKNRVLAIGGLDASNCHIPARVGPTVLPPFEAVLEAEDPAADSVRSLRANMMNGRAEEGSDESLLQ